MDAETVDVVTIGGGLAGSMAALMLQRRGLRTVRARVAAGGKEQKVVVGEALTEGIERLFAPRDRPRRLAEGERVPQVRLRLPHAAAHRRRCPRAIEDCHELLLSLTPLEKNPGAFGKLIPTYHVERTSMNRTSRSWRSPQAPTLSRGAGVEHVELGRGRAPRALCARTARRGAVAASWVIDCSGRRTVLGRQLGITHPVPALDTAAVWNRFENVNDDPAFWRTFHGVDRRRHTIHFTGQGFWIWWIHQKGGTSPRWASPTTIDQHQPDVKTDDRGFWEMMRKFPPAADALMSARAREPYQYYAHLPYHSEHWRRQAGYALIGDAAWFTDALYSIGIETAVPPAGRRSRRSSSKHCRGKGACAKTIDALNEEFAYTQKSGPRAQPLQVQGGLAPPARGHADGALRARARSPSSITFSARRRWTRRRPREALPHAVGLDEARCATSSASSRRRCATAIAISPSGLCQEGAAAGQARLSA